MVRKFINNPFGDSCKIYTRSRTKTAIVSGLGASPPCNAGCVFFYCYMLRLNRYTEYTSLAQGGFARR